MLNLSNDMAILSLVAHASIIVKIVMGILLLASMMSWWYIFVKMFSVRSAKSQAEEFEREFIIKKLEEYDWNINRTAEAIDLERSNLQRKMKIYGIDMKK